MTVREKSNSPEVKLDGTSSTVSRFYDIMGETDEADALAALVGAMPSSQVVDGWSLTKVVPSVTPIGHYIWEGRVEYSSEAAEPEEPGDVGTSTTQFETGGGSALVLFSKSTVQAVRPGGTAADFKGAINYTGKEIQGTEIIVPVFNWSVSWVFASASVDNAYIAAVYGCTAKTNNATFKNFAAGEVLFKGASGSRRKDGDWEINFGFAASQNVTGLSAGGITGINKKGWEYLWFYSEEDTSNDVLIQKPIQANVEQVYDSADFSVLGIGT